MHCQKETFNISKCSTFPMKITLRNQAGDLLPVTTDFKFVFFGANTIRGYEVSQKNGVMKNCFIEDGNIFARFENHNLFGLLSVEICERSEDNNATAGYWRWIKKMSTNVKII